MMNEKTTRIVLMYLAFVGAMVILGITLSMILGPGMVGP
jgi:hypothetical protein